MRIMDWSSDVCSSDLDAAVWASAASGASARSDAVIKKLRILCPVELGEPRTQRGEGGSWARAPAEDTGARGGFGQRLRDIEGGAAPGDAPHALLGFGPMVKTNVAPSLPSSWRNQTDERRVGKECVRTCRSRA